ncbi:hypothetical protein C5167_002386 [Papaver somniferum]|uniref:Uncharacterized protein n=2 Tax=Papaver somniferum TaxID=3469 RepID=A0A4Y7KY03_PAPSO|nr:hypothetical protein C5167_002386 [Papaver somniferum]
MFSRTSSRRHDLPKKSLHIIKEDDKFFSRLLSKENNSMANTANNSFRVYYGVASGAVPFMWESQPGTPKHPLSDTSLPPLTPPPSYYLNAKKKNKSIMDKKTSKPNLFLDTIFLKRSLRKSHVSPSLSSASSSSVSSFSSSVTTSTSSAPQTPLSSHFHKRNTRFSSPRSSFDSRGDDTIEGSSGFGSPNSILHFRDNTSPTGCVSLVVVKKALLAIVGHHGSSHGNTTTTTAA